MGRLFWKFFFAFWLAQLLTSVGVGIGVWVLRGDSAPPQVQMERFNARPRLSAPATGLAPTDQQQPPARARVGLLRRPLLPLIAGSIVSLIFAAVLAWYFSRPIRSLRQAFDAAADGKLEVRIGQALATRRDELSDLGRDFDRMAARLQTLVDGQRRLLHDVSHELRSPLARLQAAVDLLAQQPERTAEFSARIEREADRMDTLVGELLTLARLDAGPRHRFDEEVELDELVADVVEDATFEGKARDCQVVTIGSTEARLVGNRELLHRALENVVRNALKHSPAGGTVSLHLVHDKAAGWLVLNVDDEGPGVPASDLDAIFEPFVRSAGAQAFAGYGLGLAIVRRVMDLHDGRVTATNRAGGGLRISLELPTQPAPAR